jgi:hypothetical protein
MTMFMRVVNATDVHDPVSFAHYAQQTIGTKWPNVREMVILRKQADQFFEDNPRADWGTVVNTIGYVRAKRRRLAMPAAVFNQVPWAFKDGFLPELDPRNTTVQDPQVEAQIASILAEETDPWWVAALTMATEAEARRDLVRIWKEQDV